MSPYYEWDAKKDKFVRCPKPPYRIADIGGKLINFAKNEFKKWRVKRISLVVGIFNLAAKEFYKKCGFQIRRIDEAIYNA